MIQKREIESPRGSLCQYSTDDPVCLCRLTVGTSSGSRGVNDSTSDPPPVSYLLPELSTMFLSTGSGLMNEDRSINKLNESDHKLTLSSGNSSLVNESQRIITPDGMITGQKLAYDSSRVYTGCASNLSNRNNMYNDSFNNIKVSKTSIPCNGRNVYANEYRDNDAADVVSSNAEMLKNLCKWSPLFENYLNTEREERNKESVSESISRERKVDNYDFEHPLGSKHDRDIYVVNNDDVSKQEKVSMTDTEAIMKFLEFVKGKKFLDDFNDGGNAILEGPLKSEQHSNDRLHTCCNRKEELGTVGWRTLEPGKKLSGSRFSNVEEESTILTMDKNADSATLFTNPELQGAEYPQVPMKNNLILNNLADYLMHSTSNVPVNYNANNSNNNCTCKVNELCHNVINDHNDDAIIVDNFIKKCILENLLKYLTNKQGDSENNERSKNKTANVAIMGSNNNQHLHCNKFLSNAMDIKPSNMPMVSNFMNFYSNSDNSHVNARCTQCNCINCNANSMRNSDLFYSNNDYAQCASLILNNKVNCENDSAQVIVDSSISANNLGEKAFVYSPCKNPLKKKGNKNIKNNKCIKPSPTLPSLTHNNMIIQNPFQITTSDMKKTSNNLTPYSFVDLYDSNLLYYGLLSLYHDQIFPVAFNLKGRLQEFKCSSFIKANFVNMYRMFPNLYTVVFQESHEDVAIYLKENPSNFKGWIDANNDDDCYSEYIWTSFTTWIFKNQNNQDLFFCKGGRYGLARKLQELNLPFFNGFSLGMYIHIIQLAITKRKLLAYEDNILKPVATCVNVTSAILGIPNHKTKVAQNCINDIEELKHYVVKLLQFYPTGFNLSTLKRKIKTRFNRDLCQTIFHHTKLMELMTTPPMSDVCTIDMYSRTLCLKPLTGTDNLKLGESNFRGVITKCGLVGNQISRASADTSLENRCVSKHLNNSGITTSAPLLPPPMLPIISPSAIAGSLSNIVEAQLTTGVTIAVPSLVSSTGISGISTSAIVGMTVPNSGSLISPSSASISSADRSVSSMAVAKLISAPSASSLPEALSKSHQVGSPLSGTPSVHLLSTST